MSLTVTKPEYETEESYESFEEEIDEIVELLDSSLEINYFESPRGDAVGQVQSDPKQGAGILEYALESSDSNLSMRDKYLVLE